jgi:hypothetical protein
MKKLRFAPSLADDMMRTRDWMLVSLAPGWCPLVPIQAVTAAVRLGVESQLCGMASVGGVLFPGGNRPLWDTEPTQAKQCWSWVSVTSPLATTGCLL